MSQPSAPLKILISGKTGQVAIELQKHLAGLGELIVLGRDALDLSQPEQIRAQVRAHMPDLIINAGAHTAVDLAESEPDLAFAINGTAPGVLAEEAKALGIPLIHYSTDYVFDGSKPAPYTEDDQPNPLGVYGKSKLAGEQAIAAAGGQYLILRTSWVYSTHGKNFLLTMQRLLPEKTELRVVADQIGAPTWAGTIAQSTRALIERWQAGEAGAWGVVEPLRAASISTSSVRRDTRLRTTRLYVASESNGGSSPADNGAGRLRATTGLAARASVGAAAAAASGASSIKASRMMRRGSYWRGSSFFQSTSSNSGPISSRMRSFAPFAIARS